MHDRDVSVKALVRVRVLFCGGAVGGPTGVGDTDMTVEMLAFQLVFEGSYLAGGTNRFNFSVFNQGDTRAVVATIFKFLKSANQNLQCIIFTYIANNSAHSKSFIC